MGMSMGTSLFQVENMGLARAYWYLIVGVLGLFLAVRIANYAQRRTRSVNLPHVRNMAVTDVEQVTKMRHLICSVPLKTFRSSLTSLGNCNCHRS